MKSPVKTPVIPPPTLPVFFVFFFLSLGGVMADAGCKDPATAAAIAKWTGTAEQLGCLLAADLIPSEPDALSKLCFDGQALTQDIIDLSKQLAAAKKQAAEPAFKAKVSARLSALRPKDAGPFTPDEAGK